MKQASLLRKTHWCERYFRKREKEKSIDQVIKDKTRN